MHANILTYSFPPHHNLFVVLMKALALSSTAKQEECLSAMRRDMTIAMLTS